LPNGLLDGLEDGRDLMAGLPGSDNQVHVLGHEDECPEREVVFRPRPFDRFGEPYTTPLGREKSVTAIARERQFVGVPGLVEAVTTL
jgi:hypothetical protein